MSTLFFRFHTIKSVIVEHCISEKNVVLYKHITKKERRVQ